MDPEEPETPFYDKILDAAIEKSGFLTEDSPLYIRDLVVNRMGSDEKLRTFMEAGQMSEKEFHKFHREEFSQQYSAVAEALTKTAYFKDKFYQEVYKEFSELLRKDAAWQKLFPYVLSGETSFSEIFVRLVEEKTGKLVTSAKQLQQITGIYEVYHHVNSETGKLCQMKEPLTKEQAQADAVSLMKETFLLAMEHRYYNVLDSALRNGSKYKDIVSIQPSFFNLPESYKEKTIKRAICVYYDLINGFTIRPDVNTVAEELDAPYSVVFEAWREMGL
jgi:predicted CopG family antitoxin